MTILVFKNHSSVLKYWIKFRYQNKSIIHFDFHPDADAYSHINFINTNKVTESDVIFFKRTGEYNISNFMSIASILGIIRKVVWIRQDFSSLHERNKIIYDFFSTRSAMKDTNFFATDSNPVYKSFQYYNTSWRCQSCFSDDLKKTLNQYIISIDFDFFLSKKNAITELNNLLLKFEPNEYSSPIFLSISYEGGFVSHDSYLDLKNYILKNKKFNFIDCDNYFSSPLDEIYHNLQKVYWLINQNNMTGAYDVLEKYNKYLFMNTAPEWLFIQGIWNRKKGNIRKALFFYDAMNKIISPNEFVLNELSILEILNGNLSKGFYWMVNAYKIFPNSPILNSNLANYFMNIEDYFSAGELFIKALNLNILQPKAVFGLSICYDKTKREEFREKGKIHLHMLPNSKLLNIARKKFNL